MKYLWIVLLLPAFTMAAAKLKRGNELLESYREIFPKAFENQRGSDDIRTTWTNVKDLLPEKGLFNENTTPSILANQRLANIVCRFSGAPNSATLNEIATLNWNRDLKNDEHEALKEFEAAVVKETPNQRFEILCTLLASSLPFTTHNEE